MFMKISKRLVTFILAVLMVMAVTPMHVFAEGSVTNFDDFMKNLKVLEGYAKEYASEIYGKDPGELVLNFIRTGVERYQDDNWNTLAGPENTGFTSYVEAQDAEKGTTAMSLKNIVISNFTLPNGNKVDFGHMFGCMNISYVAKGSADLSGWAGDICDLLQYSKSKLDDINKNTDGSVESMAAYIRANCFGVDASGAFGWDDFWGDMDAYYLVSEYKKANGEKTFSELMEAYFNADADRDGVVDEGEYTGADGSLTLSDIDRTVYFMNNRFAVADSKEAVRKAIYESYSTDVGISILESKRGLTSYSALREASCYAVADYIYEKAQGKLIEGTPSDDGASNGYYSVFSTESSILAPGITQDIKYAQTVDGKQIVYYVATVDVNRKDVDILVNYNNNAAPVGSNIGLQTVQKQTEALVNNYRNQVDENGNKVYENFNAIVATNGAGYNITNGTPGGLVVMQGVEYYPVGAPGFFAILQDGTAVIGDQAKYNELKEQKKIKEAIQAFGSVLVKDGKISVTRSANYTANRASRTAIGITKEGKVVMMVLDGRQLPRSAGGALEEIATIMLEAGCVQAVNLDGGGSTTYLSKPAGKDDIELVNVPSDGYERRVATSLVAVSTAAPSTAFESAIISSDYEYITAGTSMQFSVKGVSNTGNAAVIPEGSYWKVSDENLASIDENGLFIAKDYGTVKVQFVVNGEIKGEKVIHIVIPDGIKFVEDRITAIYGVPKEIDVTVWYQGYPVAFTPYVDAVVLLERRLTLEEKKVIAEESGIDISEVENYTWDVYSDAGVIEGLTFTGDESQNVRTANIIAVVVTEQDEIAKLGKINLYRKDEATFDFDNATQGNRSFAWIREIENATTLDNQLYRVSDPDSPIVIDYTFALDMTAIDFPAQLEPMKSMLPTYNENASAWDYMLQLAERVCTQTSVTIKAEFSNNLDVDISKMQILTEYFEVTSKNLSPDNVLTIVCHWKNQSQPIDPATANSLCLITGLKATVKDTAAYYNNRVAITNNGAVTYDIYLAASSLYSFAQDPANQAKYGLTPYIHEEDCRSDFVTEEPDVEGEDGETATDPNPNNNDKGARFSSQYVDFADSYVVSTEILNGWYEEGKDYYYYVDNVPVTGTQLVADRHDSTKRRFYEFDATGKLVSEQGTNGLVEFQGDWYHAVGGVITSGWWQHEETKDYYYFSPSDGKAVNGPQIINELVYPNTSNTSRSDFHYTFTNYILTRGELCEATINKVKGIRYRWAGAWANGWFEVDGDTYHASSHYPHFVVTGFLYYPEQRHPDYPNGVAYFFNEKGVWQKNFTGAKFFEKDTQGIARNATYFFRNGILYTPANPVLMQGDDGCYYLLQGGYNGKVYTGINYEITTDNKGYLNGLVDQLGSYSFDSYGRMTNDLLKGKTDITDATTNKGTEESKVVCEVRGRALTVKSSVTCKILVKIGNVYKLIEAVANPYATSAFSTRQTVYEYNFAVPADATEVKIIVAGDLNGNGQVDQDDVAHLKDSILGKNGKSLTEEQKLLCDANGDGKFTAVDVALINAASKNKKKLDW